MTPEEKKSILVEIHKSIDETAKSVVDDLCNAEIEFLDYPPGIELSEKDKELLGKISIPSESKTVLQKVLADACSQPLFSLFSLLDGVTDPYVIEVPEWLGGKLGSDEEGSMLHDEFYETYWDFDENKS